MSIGGSTTYSGYNKYILQACATTATIKNHNNKVWFHFSRNFLLPLIEERYTLIYDYQNLVICKVDSSEAKPRLSASQLAVYDAITLARSECYSHQEDKIHSMLFNSKEEW